MCSPSPYTSTTPASVDLLFDALARFTQQSHSSSVNGLATRSVALVERTVCEQNTDRLLQMLTQRAESARVSGESPDFNGLFNRIVQLPEWTTSQEVLDWSKLNTLVDTNQAKSSGASLSSVLRSWQLTEVPVRSDGDCFYTALQEGAAALVHQSPQSSDSLRKGIHEAVHQGLTSPHSRHAAYIQHYSGFDEVETLRRDLKERVILGRGAGHHGDSRYWGDSLYLPFAAAVLHRPIALVQPGSTALTVYQPNYTRPNSVELKDRDALIRSRAIFLCYNGRKHFTWAKEHVD